MGTRCSQCDCACASQVIIESEFCVCNVSLISIERLLDTGHGERGMVCTAPVAKDTMVLSVPFDSLLTVASLERSELGTLLPNGLREDDILALLLLHEKHVRGQTPLQPFF